MTVVPTVVTNLPIGTGSTTANASAPAVTDLVILRRYLTSGQLESPSQFGPDGVLENLGEVTHLCRTAGEFEDNIVPFLAAPPVVEGYRAALAPQIIYMQLADGWLQKILTLHVDPERVETSVLEKIAAWNTPSTALRK